MKPHIGFIINQNQNGKNEKLPEKCRISKQYWTIIDFVSTRHYRTTCFLEGIYFKVLKYQIIYLFSNINMTYANILHTYNLFLDLLIHDIHVKSYFTLTTGFQPNKICLIKDL